VTDLEQRAIQALCYVMFSKKSGDIFKLARLERSYPLLASTELSIEQQADLWFLVWRYRRQIQDADVVMHADDVVNGALNLRF
jgi:hypothetical protein